MLRLSVVFMCDVFTWGHGGCANDGGSILGVLRRMLGDMPCHLTWKCLRRVDQDLRTSGAEFSNLSYQLLACEFVYIDE